MNHIKQLRIRSGFRTSRLAAELLGISHSMMKQMECGIKRPSIDLGFVMVRVFNCTLEEIFNPYSSQIVKIESKDESYMYDEDGDKYACYMTPEEFKANFESTDLIPFEC